ncbi:hypothetical protein GCM10027562_18580 [Arthrobacter pigmenti]
MAMNLQMVLNSITAVCLIGGALMSLTAAIGLVRFPDLLSRMHSATKPQVLGLLLMLTAVAIQLRTWELVPLLIIAWIFQLLTSPVSAHMVGRAGYRTKHLHKDLLKLDELDEVVEAAAQYRASEYRKAARAGESPEEAVEDQESTSLPEEAELPAEARVDDDGSGTGNR